MAKKPEYVTPKPLKKGPVLKSPPAKKQLAALGAKAAPRAATKRVPATTAEKKALFKKHHDKKIAPQPAWYITLVFGNATGVFGLANDQRVYRWNTRSALWVLHKEGLSATQQ